MMNRTQFISILAFLGAGLCYATPAFAYLDPGTGSIILQGLIATIAGLLVAGRLYWERVKQFFAGLMSGGKNESSDDARTESPMDSDAHEIAKTDDDK